MASDGTLVRQLQEYRAAAARRYRDTTACIDGKLTRQSAPASPQLHCVGASQNGAQKREVRLRKLQLSEIVGCSHPSSMRCSHCIGRLGEDAMAALSSDHIREAHKKISEVADLSASPSESKRIARAEASRWTRKGVTKRALTYGEVSFWSFTHILWSLRPQKEDIFYDLGSGSGLAVLIASQCFPFKKCVGIELIEGLHHMAVSRLQNIRASKGASGSAKFINGDFFQTDWSDATVVYIASTAFDDATLLRIAKVCEHLPKGTQIISLSKPLPSASIRVQRRAAYRMAWAPAVSVFFAAVY